jgi:hypothetical protein
VENVSRGGGGANGVGVEYLSEVEKYTVQPKNEVLLVEVTIPISYSTQTTFPQNSHNSNMQGDLLPSLRGVSRLV